MLTKKNSDGRVEVEYDITAHRHKNKTYEDVIKMFKEYSTYDYLRVY